MRRVLNELRNRNVKRKAFLCATTTPALRSNTGQIATSRRETALHCKPANSSRSNAWIIDPIIFPPLTFFSLCFLQP
jgi:hypothetical protein